MSPLSDLVCKGRVVWRKSCLPVSGHDDALVAIFMCYLLTVQHRHGCAFLWDLLFVYSKGAC